MQKATQKITPFLWFDNQAEEAMHFYCSVFPNSRPAPVSRYGENVPTPSGEVQMVSFELDGQPFMALNGGPLFPFTPAISLLVSCQTQAEIDELWAKLSADPDAEQCGWLKDKFGLSWQIVPAILQELLQDEDKTKANNAMQAMLQMKKLDIEKLQAAHAG